MTSLSKQKMDRKFCIALGASCIIIVILFIPFTFIVYAAPPVQTQQQQQQQIDTDQRLTRLETEVEEQQSKLDKVDPVVTENRLTRLESSLDTIKNLLIALVTGIGLMLLEAGHRLLSPKEIIELGKKE